MTAVSSQLSQRIDCPFANRLFRPAWSVPSFPSFSNSRSRSKVTPLPQVYPFSRTGYYALDPKQPPKLKVEKESKVWVSVGLEPK